MLLLTPPINPKEKYDVSFCIVFIAIILFSSVKSVKNNSLCSLTGFSNSWIGKL